MLGRSGLLCDVRGVGWAGMGCCVTRQAYVGEEWAVV